MLYLHSHYPLIFCLSDVVLREKGSRITTVYDVQQRYVMMGRRRNTFFLYFVRLSQSVHNHVDTILHVLAAVLLVD